MALSFYRLLLTSERTNDLWKQITRKNKTSAEDKSRRTRIGKNVKEINAAFRHTKSGDAGDKELRRRTPGREAPTVWGVKEINVEMKITVMGNESHGGNKYLK